MNRILFLVGFMGSGKTFLGKKIANKFSMHFIDLDQLIEEKEGKSINQIFAENGENFFRELEAKILRETDFSNALVATGGGTPCYNDNVNYMKSIGAVAYLLVPLEILIGRLRQNKDERPLLKNLESNELDQFVINKYNERKVFYEQADFIILHNKPLNAMYRDLSFLL